MTAVCFVCNLPILSHQVGLVWQSGNCVEDLSRDVEPPANLVGLRGRLGRRDSATQFTTVSPPRANLDISPNASGRRRSSLAQLTDILREWGSKEKNNAGGNESSRTRGRRESLADLARNLPWGRKESAAAADVAKFRKRRESLADFSKHQGRRDSGVGSSASSPGVDISRFLGRRERDLPALGTLPKRSENRSNISPLILSDTRNTAKAVNVACGPSTSNTATSPGLPQETFKPSPVPVLVTSSTIVRPSPSPPRLSPVQGSVPSSPRFTTFPTDQQTCLEISLKVGFGDRLTKSTESAASVTESGADLISLSEKLAQESFTEQAGSRRSSNGLVVNKTRRDSNSQTSPERTGFSFQPPPSPPALASLTLGSRETSPKLHRLRRQSTTLDEGIPIGGKTGRRGSRPFLSPDATSGNEDGWKKSRRDSLSPDSAAEDGLNGFKRGRRDSRSYVNADGDTVLESSRGRLRRQSTATDEMYRIRSRRGSKPRPPRSDSSSTCSSREPSPKEPSIRRQSTTEEILIARGFRRQSTTEEMIRCRNFRRQSTTCDDLSRTRGRRDSCAQITDGTVATMTVETTSTFFDTSTQTEPSSLYDNNYYHEECLRCNSCGVNLTGPSQKRARRFKNQIFCDLHFSDVALLESSDVMQQLRSFKPQSLGCAVARRKSSTTLIFPLPPQACSDEFCDGYPHNFLPTPGYWIECSRQSSRKRSRNTDGYGSDQEIQEEELEEQDSEQGESPTRSESREFDSVKLHHQNIQVATSPPGLWGQPRVKTATQEQYDRTGTFELTSVEQETYERYFYGTEHWNYFSNDEDLGPVILSLKQEIINGRDQFRILVRAISYTVHGLIPASCVFADRYNREEVVRSLGKEINLNPPLILGQLPDTPEELLKLDQVFIKSELKVGVIFVKEGQHTEEEILDNNENSILFDEFLQVLGDKVRLRGFDKYKGGLDTVHDLTGLYSVYTHWRSIEIMFHVSTLLPYEKHDPQKLQRKRHVGNDIVCVVFLEADRTDFSPACIKSHFLHTFILVRVSPKSRHKPTRYEVSVVTRDEVGAYKPYLWEQSVFYNGNMFREWILTKIVNGERASYSAPKFARMQERTRSQMLEDIVANLQNHAETGQIPKPYRRGSWRPIGHMRPSSPLLDSVRDRFEGYDQLAKDFTRAFVGERGESGTAGTLPNTMIFDITFLVGQGKQKSRLHAVRAILGVRSRVFQEMLYGICTGFGSPQVPVAELLARAVPTLHSPSQRPKSSNFLQVPDIESPRPKSVPSSPMVVRAFSRLGNLTAGWGRSSKKQDRLTVEDKKWISSQDCSKEGKDSKNDRGASLAVPRLSVCADTQKVDRTRLAQTEFSVIEFDADSFRILLDYLHTGSCPLTCNNIPGLICAAEHYDLPELLQACFHHAKQFLRIEVVCSMLSALENYYWRYTSASELVNMILSFIESRASQVFQCPNFLSLSESIVQMIMARNLEVPEVRKFEAMVTWAKHRVRTKGSSKVDAKVDFRCTMERLSRDLRLYRISPQDLIKVVLPSKAIKNERILETLMFQANSGMYRIQDSYLEACQQRLQKQDSRFSEWDSFDYGA